MRRETTYRCAGPDCPAHMRSHAPAPPRGWILVAERADDGALEEHDYCGWTCLLHSAAKVDPEETLPVDIT